MRVNGSWWTGAVGLTVLVVMAGCGKSQSTPAAVPTPAPTPTPAAAASPVPAGFVCPFPAMPDLHNDCPKLTPVLDQYVNNAVETVIAQKPQLFDFSNNLGEGSWKVLDHDAYVSAVVDAIHAQGICAKDDKEEVAVKKNNQFNEQYNIYTSGGYVRRAYITTCVPAQF